MLDVIATLVCVNIRVYLLLNRDVYSEFTSQKDTIIFLKDKSV